MKINVQPLDLLPTHPWTIARDLTDGSRTKGKNDSRTDTQSVCPVVVVKLHDAEGRTGYGEAAPTDRYGETTDTVQSFLQRIDPSKLSAGDRVGSMVYVDTLESGNAAAKGAIDIALWDLRGKREGKAVYDLLELGFKEQQHVTSFSIGIDEPESIKRKVEAADRYPVLKIKLGSADDRAILRSVREIAPTKPLRVDANEAWCSKEDALRNIEWLAADKHIEFVEQPMPAASPVPELKWLRDRSPLPIMADESYHTADDAELCAECFHAVNVKLVKSAGISGAHKALIAARKRGLKTMVGCMIETSILISAAAHLAALTDYLDIDGNLLITNDPYAGATADAGIISFATAKETAGLRVSKKVERG